jgi:acetyl esterase
LSVTGESDKARQALQLLIYPATDFTFDGPSIHENAKDYFLTIDDMNWFMNYYLNSDADKKNPLASPLQSANLRGLPAALVITAEYDPLRDEGEAYGKRLKEAGVPVTISRYNGVIHGFLSLEPLTDKGKQAREECAQALRAAFAMQ